jgi:hypothetical protein
MKYTRQMLIAVTLIVMPMLATAQFGQTVSISTQVPFEFVVGDRVVPAGKCVLQAANAAAETILIRNDDKMVRLFSSTSLGDARNVPTSNQYFTNTGERYFLAAVRVQGTRIMYWLPESKQEARLRQQDQSSAEETIHAF